jgi:hypothetical protein
MSTEAFGSRRVSESLRAIAKYLDEGALIAGGIPPGQAVKLQLEPTPSTPGPRLIKVQVINTKSGAGTVQLDVLAVGENLESVSAFKLVGAPSGSTYFEASEIKPKDTGSFTAHITLTEPYPVSYHAFVVTKSGQTFLLRDALTIKAREGTDTEPGLQLVALIPPRSKRKNQLLAAMVVRKRKDESYRYQLSFTDTDDNDVGLSAKVATKQQVDEWKDGHEKNRLYEVMREYAGLTTVPLIVTIPTELIGSGVFYLVARSEDGAEDKLAFVVGHADTAGTSSET